MQNKVDERLGLPSASSWHRYELCHGSYQLGLEARRLGQEAHIGGEAARRGERIHAYLAGEVDEDGNEIVLSVDEAETADFLQARAQEQAERIFGEEPRQQLAEKRLWLIVNGRKAASGRFDRVVYTPTLALIQDFKTGQREPQEAEMSAQMKFLAVVVGLALPSVKEIVVQVVSVFYGVSERRFSFEDSGQAYRERRFSIEDLAQAYRERRFSIEDLAQAYRDVLKTLRAMQAPGAPLSPSVEACRYCPAKLICPALQEKRVGIARMDLVALPDGAQGAMILDDVAIIRSRCDEIVEYYQAKMLADPAYELPGYAMVAGNVRREVTDWKAARQRLGEWIELEDIEGAANYRLGDLERALAKKLKLKAKEAKARMNEILQGLVEEKQNAASLKRVNAQTRLIEIAMP